MPVGRLDDLSDATVPILIKLDVEGVEEQVLYGASRVLRSPFLLAAQSELCRRQLRKRFNRSASSSYFHPFARRWGAVSFGYRISNALFVRRSELLTKRLADAVSRVIGGKTL